MKIRLTDSVGKVVHEFEITSGAPDTPPEIVRYPQYGGTYVLCVRDTLDGYQAYRPAKGIVEFPE